MADVDVLLDRARPLGHHYQGRDARSKVAENPASDRADSSSRLSQPSPPKIAALQEERLQRDWETVLAVASALLLGIILDLLVESIVQLGSQPQGNQEPNREPTGDEDAAAGRIAEQAANDPDVQDSVQGRSEEELRNDDSLQQVLQPHVDEELERSGEMPGEQEPSVQGEREAQQETSSTETESVASDLAEGSSGKGEASSETGEAAPELVGSGPTQVIEDGELLIAPELIEAFRRDLAQTRAYLQEAEGQRIAEAWGVQATIFEDRGDRLIVQYGPVLGTAGQAGNLLFVNRGHYVVIEEVSALNPEYDYICVTQDNQIRKFKESKKETPSDGNCLIHGLQLIRTGALATPEDIADARGLAEQGIDDGQVSLMLTALIHEILDGIWPGGLGPVTTDYLRRDPMLMGIYRQRLDERIGSIEELGYDQALEIIRQSRRFREEILPTVSLNLNELERYDELEANIKELAPDLKKGDLQAATLISDYFSELRAILEGAEPKKFEVRSGRFFETATQTY